MYDGELQTDGSGVCLFNSNGKEQHWVGGE